MRERARLQARETLETSFPEILPEEIDRQLRNEFNILLPRDVMVTDGYP